MLKKKKKRKTKLNFATHSSILFHVGKNALRNCWYFPFTVSYWKNLCGLERMRKHYLDSDVFFFNENFKEKGL